MSDSKIIVPWDFSKHARFALKFAMNQVAASDIVVICVLERPGPYATSMPWSDELEEHAIEQCRNSFAETMQDEPRAGELTFVIRFGDPAEQIVDVAEDRNAESIVISSHGRTGISKMILGSVASRVLQLAKTPVTVLSNRMFEETTH